MRRRYQHARAPRLEMTPGVYSTIPVWQGRQVFAVAVEKVIESQPWRAPRRESFRVVMEALAKFADHATGRDAAPSLDLLERRTGLERRTILRRLADARTTGLVVTVDRGRHLTRDERQAVKGRSITKTSTRALTHEPVAVTPTPSRREESSSHLSLTHQTRKRVAKTSPRSHRTAPRSMQSQRLAAQLDRRYGWLTKGRHIGSLCDVLVTEGVDTWSENDVARALDGWHERHGWTNLGAHATNPLGWFAMSLRRARQEGAESLSQASLRAKAQAHAKVAQRAQEDAERLARAEQVATSQVAQDAKAAIRAQIAAAQRSRRSR